VEIILAVLRMISSSRYIIQDGVKLIVNQRAPVRANGKLDLPFLFVTAR
jgi:hypothetical protein